jgi:arsenate reductase (thioredoxin)
MKRVLFICVHNEARSQMAEAFFNKLAIQGNIDLRARSAGIDPGEEIDPTVRQAMNEIGFPLETQFPKPLSQTMLNGAHYIVTMGCGVETVQTALHLSVTEDWRFPDPKGRPLEEVRSIRDGIRAKATALIEQLAAEALVGENR